MESFSLDLTLVARRSPWRPYPSLIVTLKVNRAHVGINGLLDPSQHGNGHHFRNFRLGGGRPFKFGLVSSSRFVLVLWQNNTVTPYNGTPVEQC